MGEVRGLGDGVGLGWGWGALIGLVAGGSGGGGLSQFSKWENRLA